MFRSIALVLIGIAVATFIVGLFWVYGWNFERGPTAMWCALLAGFFGIWIPGFLSTVWDKP